MSIKTLSLFFIDEVAKYRQYDEDGNEMLASIGACLRKNISPYSISSGTC